MNTVYLDVLIAENMLMNFVILHITSRITSTASSIKRLMFGAAVGTAYAVVALGRMRCHNHLPAAVMVMSTRAQSALLKAAMMAAILQ